MAAPDNFSLQDGSRIAVVGAGPAGSMFSFFVLQMAQRVGLELAVDIYEPRDFNTPGAGGCNHCGGIVSEWLVQTLAMEGIRLGSDVVQRGIDSYTMHLDSGSVRIEAPHEEKRIAAVHRGGGPRGVQDSRWSSFDAYLFGMAQEKGAHWMRKRVECLRYANGGIELQAMGGEFAPYDLVVVAVGKRNQAKRMFDGLEIPYRPPKMVKAYISEIFMGEAEITRQFGHSMHLFMPDLPGVKFGALIPKGDYVTLCMLGNAIKPTTVDAFLRSPEVRRSMPEGWVMPERLCHCSPSLPVQGAHQPYADRLLFVGDCSVSRLYKDGIGAAYRAAKAASVAVVHEGVSATALQRHYWPTLRSIARDNQFGRIIFLVTALIQHMALVRHGVLRMVRREQKHPERPQRMSIVLWYTFTGSAPYRDIFVRTLHPAFLLRFFSDILVGLFRRPHPERSTRENSRSRVGQSLS